MRQTPLNECLTLLLDARKLLDSNPDISLDTTDTSMEKYLKDMSRHKGAKKGSIIKTQNGKDIEFTSWGVPNCISWLESKRALSKGLKESFFRIHELRNQVKHKGFHCNRTLAERAIAVIEFAVRAQMGKKVARKTKQKPLPEIIPRTGERHVQAGDLPLWEKRGWEEVRRRGSTVTIRRRYEDDEKLEMKVRFLLRKLDFEGVPDLEDFWYDELGYQVDACGGADGVFLVIDCTTTNEPGHRRLKAKMDDVLKKRSKISKKIDEIYKGAYHTKVFAICTEDIIVSKHDREEVERNGLKLIDSEQIEDWTWYQRTLGVSLKYHIVRGLAGFSPVMVDDTGEPMFRFEAFRVRAGERVFYYFLAGPESLLRLAYVYRLDLTNPLGYQRELNKNKITKINDFLGDSQNYFANNLVLSFDSLADDKLWPDFKARNPDGGLEYGVLQIPKIYASAEIIDGQHRLYGYYDETMNPIIRRALARRRKMDRLSVVAISDPDETQRATLFVDINSNQTKVNIRKLWALMSSVRPRSPMGFVSNIIIQLNQLPTFKYSIEIPGKYKGQGDMNIANLGKGLLDRKLFGKSEKWNLYAGNRRAKDYEESEGFLKQQAKALERYYKPFEGKVGVSGFVFTNNGFNVVLRVVTDMLKRKWAGQKIDLSKFNSQAPKVVNDFVKKQGIRRLLKRTSNEAERATIADKISSKLLPKLS